MSLVGTSRKRRLQRVGPFPFGLIASLVGEVPAFDAALYAHCQPQSQWKDK